MYFFAWDMGRAKQYTTAVSYINETLIKPLKRFMAFNTSSLRPLRDELSAKNSREW